MLLQTLGKLRSLQGTELSVVVVICLLRIVLNFNFEFKVWTDRNKRSEMFIRSMTICLFRYDMYSCKLIFIWLS